MEVAKLDRLLRPSAPSVKTGRQTDGVGSFLFRSLLQLQFRRRLAGTWLVRWLPS